MKKLNAAEYVIWTFGGVQRTADALGITKSSVSHWRVRGHGRIPVRHFTSVMRAAQQMALDITAQDLVTGRSVLAKHYEERQS